jgi:hypothetical protein
MGKATLIIGGQSDEWERNDADFYPTPDDCTTALIDAVPSLLTTGVIWEPACGDGAVSKLLMQRGATVVSTDLHDRGFGMVGVDFLKARNVFGAKTIITNPPFFLAEDFIRHAAGMGVYIAMLLKGTYWHSARRLKLFEDTRPAMVLPMTWRPNFAPNRGKSPTMEFCWTVWGAGPSSRCEYAPLRKPA